MELKLYFRMLQRGWWLIALAAIAGLSVALGNIYLTIPQYQATARFILSPSSSITSGRDVVDSLDTLDRPSIAATYAEILNSNRIFTSACQLLGRDPLVLAKTYTVQTVVLPESSVLELTVTGPDPQLAAGLANSIGQQAIGFTRSLNQVYDLNILDSAAVPEKPFSPEPIRDSVLGLVLGGALGAILAVVNEQIRIPIEAYRNRLRLDGETGAYNQIHFSKLLEDEIGGNSEKELSIGIIELNGLSDYRGTLPPAGIQSLLVKVTETLRRELRGNDAIGRWNETSFSVLLPTTAGVAAHRTFDRIYQALNQPVELPAYGVVVNLNPRIGGAVYSNTITMQELLDKTQTSLDRAKRDNVNPVYVWELKSPFWVRNEVSG